MADILLNVDGTQKVYKNTVHLAANTESGGKAVYTEESETTTAYLLTDPTGEMPTFGAGSAAYFSGDNKYWCGAVNAAEGVITAPFVGYLDKNTNEYYIYTGTVQTLTGAVMKSFDATWAAGDWNLQTGWNYAMRPDSSSSNAVIFYRRPDITWVQKHLRGNGGIPTSAFAWDTMDKYTKSIFLQTEVLKDKTPDYQQSDTTGPGYIKHRPGGFYLPTRKALTIEWDGEIGSRPYLGDVGTYYVQVYSGTLFMQDFFGVTITVTVQAPGAEATTRTRTFSEEFFVDHELDMGDYFMLGDVGIVVPYDTTVMGVFLEAGIYVIRAGNSSTGVSFVSKIELPEVLADRVPVPVPVSSMFMPKSMTARHIILESTTSGSTKKFKITVDDSGALKATEVIS